MEAAVFRGLGDVRIESIPDPEIEAPTDAVVPITHRVGWKSVRDRPHDGMRPHR